MNSKEILKETKISYEYLRDIAENGNLDIDSNKIRKLSETLDVLESIYSSTYNKMKNDDKEKQELCTDLNCPHCSNAVNISDLIDYAYVCEDCDENYYYSEMETEKAWYLDEESRNINKSFDLKLSYDINTKKLVIVEDKEINNYIINSYNGCKTVNDVSDVLADYINETKVKNYIIKYWESEESRNQGYSNTIEYSFYDLKVAIDYAKQIFNENNYASVEIYDQDNEVYYCQDNESADYFVHNHRYYSEVNIDKFKDYIFAWNCHKDLPINTNLIFCKDDDKYLGIDNSSNECYVEEFENEEDVINWLTNKEKVKEEYEL